MRTLLPIAALTLAALQPPAPARQPVTVAAPDFTLPDAHTGAERSLHEFARAGRPVALFFFCGCAACHAVATEWGTFQRGGVLPACAATVIVYQSDEADEARAFARATGLDPKYTAVLLDGGLRVTDTLYHALPCPRLLVLDGGGTVRYVNPRAGDADAGKNAAALTARVLSALQAAAVGTRGDARP